MTDQPEHHLSKDGSSTLYSRQYGQYYHNPNGAISESRYVFLEHSGLLDFLASEAESCTVLEIGFGTGLNFFLLAEEYIQRELSFPLHFYSVEAYPVDPDLTDSFNYAGFMGEHTDQSHIRTVFTNLEKGWNIRKPLEGKNITLHLFHGFFNELESIRHAADFIFHDPFSPEVNDELWQPDTFKKIKTLSKESAILSTYCAASKARAAMAKAGWLLSRVPGALGKREMTVASPDAGKLSFKRINEGRLIERYDAGDFD